MNNVYSVLKGHYPSQEYVLMEEVSDSTGSRSQSADYIVMSLWASRGHYLSGIELKSNRTDWLRELKRPAKAENIFNYCDYWWLLTEDESVAKLEEIPEPWGWMTIKGNRIFVKKKAPKLAPKHITRNFLACMLRRAGDKTNYIKRDEVANEIDRAREEGKNIRESEMRNLRDNYDELKKNVEEFRAACGINLNRGGYWSGDAAKIKGEAVKFLCDGGTASIVEDLLKLEDTAKKVLSQISQALITFKAQTY